MEMKKKIKIKENDTAYPETIYGINKLATEKFIIQFQNLKNLDWLIIRLFAIWVELGLIIIKLLNII